MRFSIDRFIISSKFKTFTSGQIVTDGNGISLIKYCLSESFMTIWPVKYLSIVVVLNTMNMTIAIVEVKIQNILKTLAYKLKIFVKALNTFQLSLSDVHSNISIHELMRNHKT